MLLKRLSEARGLPGYEDEVRNLLREHLRPHVDQLYTDTLGNLIAIKGRGDYRVLLDAHMDEVGLVVSGFESAGLLRFETAGGIDPRVLPGRKVLVGDKGLPGVVGLKAVHLVSADERNRPPGVKDLFIDIGAGDRAEAERHVALGDPVVWDTRFEELGGQRVKGRALDDRAGCALLAELLTGPAYPGLTLCAVFSVQEEVGLRGAQVAAHRLAPHLALGFEATICADLPGVPSGREVTELGKGPAISLVDARTVHNRAMIRALVRLAEAGGLAYQFRRAVAGGTNSGAIALSRGGVPVANLSVPCRYLHSAALIVDLQDYAALLRLVQMFLAAVEKGEFRL